MRPDESSPLTLPAFLLRHTIIGFMLAALFVAALLVFDLGGIGTLALSSDVGVLAVVLLTFFMGLSFASAQTAFAIMMASRRDDDEQPGSAVLSMLRRDLLPLPVRRRS